MRGSHHVVSPHASDGRSTTLATPLGHHEPWASFDLPERVGPDRGLVAEVRDLVHISHHVLLLSEDGWHPGDGLPVATNGLVGSAGRCTVIYTGIHSGVVELTVQVRSAPPQGVDLDWDEVVEIVLRAAGEVRVASLMADVPATFPALTSGRARSYRLRVHARGRDTDIDGTAFAPCEHYLVQVWPAGPAPEVVYKQTDRYGGQRRLFAQ